MLCPNIINFDAVDFSEHRPEEVISFFWCSVYIYTHIYCQFIKVEATAFKARLLYHRLTEKDMCSFTITPPSPFPTEATSLFVKSESATPCLWTLRGDVMLM